MADDTLCPCGKPAEHVNADPESQDWACRLPERTPPAHQVPQDFLVRVDSYCSLVAHRGLDDESREELRRLSLEARRIYDPR